MAGTAGGSEVKSAIAPYIAVSFGIAWVCWAICWCIINRHLHLPLTLFAILGSFGPLAGAGLCSWGEGGAATRRFFARGFNPKMGWPVFVTAFCLLPVLATLTALLYAWKTGQHFAFQMSWAELPIAYLWLFILGGPIAEEFGWSYLSDGLDEKFDYRIATLILGLVWGFWHLPLFFLIVPGLLQHYMPFEGFLLLSVSMRFLFSWAYHRSNRNILSNLIFHNALNLSLSIVTIVPSAPDPGHPRFWLLIGLSALTALILWIFSPPLPLQPPPQRREA
jgi:hypothetical protein